jgi:hypothetical protein
MTTVSLEACPACIEIDENESLKLRVGVTVNASGPG